MNEALRHRAVPRTELRKPPAVGVATEGSLSALYHRDYHRFVRVAEAITGTVEDAQDAVQEGFASAICQLAAFEGRGSLEGWVWRCVINAARMSRRRAARPAPFGHVPEIGDVGVSTSEARARLLPQLLGLPERQRLVLFLRYFADLPYEAIADALEISSGTVAATLNAAHRSLRSRLQEVEE